MQIYTVSERLLLSISRKIVVEAGRHRGRNFMERGQIGVIMMFSMVRSISGPLNVKLLQKEPMGVEMSSPSPLNCPILMISFSQLFSMQMLMMTTAWFMALLISTWQVASPNLSQAVASSSFMRLSVGRAFQFGQWKTREVIISACWKEQLQIRGDWQSLVLPMPKMGGVSRPTYSENTWKRSRFYPTTNTRSILSRHSLSVASMTLVHPSSYWTSEQQWHSLFCSSSLWRSWMNCRVEGREVLAMTRTLRSTLAMLRPISTKYYQNKLNVQHSGWIALNQTFQVSGKRIGEGRWWMSRYFLVVILNSKMDPTKPILDLYGDSSYDYTQRNKPARSQPPPTYKSTRQHQQKQISYAQLKEKYQELYQAYSEKVERSNGVEDQLEYLRNENEKLKEQVHRLEDKNEQLNSTLLNKNIELEEAYRQLQEDIKRGQRTKKNDDALNRLEEGMREAIVSNFNLLKEAAMSELKHY